MKVKSIMLCCETKKWKLLSVCARFVHVISILDLMRSPHTSSKPLCVLNSVSNTSERPFTDDHVPSVIESENSVIFRLLEAPIRQETKFRSCLRSWPDLCWQKRQRSTSVFSSSASSGTRPHYRSGPLVSIFAGLRANLVRLALRRCTANHWRARGCLSSGGHQLQLWAGRTLCRHAEAFSRSREDSDQLHL